MMADCTGRRNFPVASTERLKLFLTSDDAKMRSGQDFIADDGWA